MGNPIAFGIGTPIVPIDIDAIVTPPEPPIQVGELIAIGPNMVVRRAADDDPVVYRVPKGSITDGPNLIMPFLTPPLYRRP